MKKMVVKRKRKDVADSPSEPANDTNDEERKRTKVHAQRKFAQGQQGPKSAYLSYNLTSGQSTPEGKLKESSNTPPVDILPNIRPNTEDFLTFLCFRGTNMLPKNLDFYNQSANQPSTSSAPSTSTAATTNTSKPLIEVKNAKKTPAKCTENNKKSRDKRDTKESPEPSLSTVLDPKTGFMPGAARKRAEMVPETNNKKKQQSQTKKIQNDNKQEKISKTIETEKNGKITVAKKKRKSKLNNAESLNSLEMDKSPAKAPKLSIEANANQKIKLVLAKNDKKPEMAVKNQTQDSNAPKKKTPKKQAEKPTTRLSALRNNTSSPDGKNGTDFEFSLKINSAVTKVNDFSSDDDEPLVMAKVEKKQDMDGPKSKKPKIVAANNLKTIEDANNTALAPKSKTKLPEMKSKKVELQMPPIKVIESNMPDKPSPSVSDSKSNVKIRGRKKKEALTEKVEKEKNTKILSPELKKPVRKKKMSADAEIAEHSQANTTDLSENEGRATARPSRKTKEAATIYMELIGRKLTLHDFSDNDASSLDSLELPNFRAQIEMERKATMDHQKESPSQEKKDEEKSELLIKKIKSNQKLSKAKQSTIAEADCVKDLTKESKKLENSFSDSDEEPLATKLKQQKPIPKKRGRKSAKELAEAKRIIECEKIIPPAEPSKTLIESKVLSAKVPTATIESLQTTNMNVGPLNRIKTSEESTKQNQPNDSFSKLFQQSVEKPLKLQKTGDVPFNRINKLEMRDDDEFVRNFDNTAASSKPINLIPKASIDLLPSKEESEKIFGIASVTLAQSSGPLDTKCTLGKCGSIHKPPLGPAILTESALGASLASLAPKDRRKSKVNMTRMEIHRWLDESTWTPIKDDLDIDECSAELPPKSNSSLMSSNQQEKLEKQVEKPSTSKGPTLKAKPVAINLKQETKNTDIKITDNVPKLIKTEPVVITPVKSIQIDSPNVPTPKIKEVAPKISSQKTKSKTPTSAKTALNNMDKKPVYKQQIVPRTPVYKTPAEKPKQKQPGSILNPFGAFSPENEHSVYSFDREDDDIPAATPFRRQSRQDSRTEEFGVSNKDPNDSFPKLQSTGHSTPIKQITQSQISFTLSPEDHSKKSALIQESGKNSNDIKTEDKGATNDNDSDSEGHTFYIPLQATNVSGSKNDQLIQGVAVKLGTEGADGPNQRIIMHAKLVTKSRIGSNSQALPESMTEVVKTLMANKDLSAKSVPCATVQPRFKSSDNEPIPGTSQVKNKLGPVIGKLNKYQNEAQIQPSNNTAFPCHDDPAQMVEAPVFRPTEKEFQDPIEYIERIAPIASRFGICRIIPPESFKPECRVSDEMRFTAYNQYVHRTLHRWGPSAKEFAAIKKYLATQSIVFQHPPLIAGMEVDLPRLYHTVQELGGLREVIEKKKWAKVSEDMCIPKTAHDRVTKLDDIYCKYLLPYDTLSHSERQKLFDEVEADWAKREAKARRNADKCVESDEQSDEDSENDDESEEAAENDSMECMVKGRTMALSQFYRVARNTMALWFKNTEPTSAEIEVEYWRHVAVRDSHVCVHYGSIDSSGFGYGFPAPGPKGKSSPCSKHAWNLKVMTNNSGSILRSLGPVMGVTVPTLHVGMLFSAVCWYRDPHGLPWIEYLHTGASKIWYAVPDDQSSHFRSAMTSLVPSHCQNKTIWLPCDTAMVPPYMLTDRNVSLCRTEQEPGQFVVVFPRVYTSSLCTGYTVSESVYFATSSWLDTANEDFKDIQDSCEPTMFSLEQLLFAIANDQRTDIETLDQVVPMMLGVFEIEKQNRQSLKELGVTGLEKITEANKRKSTEEYECNYCRANLHISWIKVSDDDEDVTVYCLKHAIKYLNEDRIQPSKCKLVHTYTVLEIENLLKKLNDRMAPPSPKHTPSTGNAKKKPNKYAGSMVK